MIFGLFSDIVAFDCKWLTFDVREWERRALSSENRCIHRRLTLFGVHAYFPIYSNVAELR